MMPETTFIWFGGGNDSLVTQEVKEAVKNAKKEGIKRKNYKLKKFRFLCKASDLFLAYLISPLIYN